jgi:putative photosynthetic complex assembly protein
MSAQYSTPLGTGTPWPIWVIGAVLVATLTGVAWQRHVSGGVIASDTPAVVWQQTLRFEDRPNGDVAALDAASGREVARFKGEQGFVRGSLRALARERAVRQLGPEAPFELMGHVDGRVTLRDTATGERLNLESFGPTNAAIFSQLRWAQTTPGVKP